MPRCARRFTFRTSERSPDRMFRTERSQETRRSAVVRDGIVIAEDQYRIAQAIQGRCAVRLRQGYECGVGLDKFNDIHEGDIMEAFIMEEVER